MTKRARASISVALAIVLSGCGPKAKPQIVAAPPSPKGAVEQLQRDLNAIFTSPNINHALWSIEVRSLKTDETLFAINPTRMQTPASTMKVITAAVAADRRGWTYRFSTGLYAIGRIENGTLEGDLVVVSDGDPSINRRHPEREHIFDSWAKQLHEKGIRRVRGRLIGDDNAFAEPGWGFGWSWDDLVLGYGAAVGGLQYNENELQMQVTAGVNPGDHGTVTISPAGSGVILDNAVVTAAADQSSRVSVQRIPGSNMLRVSGQVAAGAKPVSLDLAAPNPTVLYVNALREALARNGVVVEGDAVDVDDLGATPDYTNATRLVDDKSPPLSDIIDACLKWSLNDYAETLLRLVATESQQITAEAGLVTVNSTLKQWGVAPEMYVARDGSGLSRNDYLAPEVLVNVLTHIWRDPNHVDHFRSALPQSATSGLMANRMKNTVAAERVWAKDGSMSNVRSLAGYAMTLDNEPLVFAFMATGFHVPSSQIDATIDEALVRLVKFPRELHEE